MKVDYIDCFYKEGQGTSIKGQNSSTTVSQTRGSGFFIVATVRIKVQHHGPLVGSRSSVSTVSASRWERMFPSRLIRHRKEKGPTTQTVSTLSINIGCFSYLNTALKLTSRYKHDRFPLCSRNKKKLPCSCCCCSGEWR